MPITTYTRTNLRKLKKDELISHVSELYGGMWLFDDESSRSKTIEENKKLKEEMKLMYKIIMNDDESNLMIATDDRKAIDVLQDCISLMLEKFKMMGEKIVNLTKEKDELHKEWVIHKNEANIGNEFIKAHITSLLENLEYGDGQITVPHEAWFSEFMREHFHKHIDKLLVEMTTYSSSGYGAYDNGYWYCEGSLDRYELHHDGKGTICVDRVETSDEE
jgi:hypothetical protein